MRIGKVPVASLILLILCLTKLGIMNFLPESYAAAEPVIDGIMMAAVVVFLLYYVRIWVGAWLNNRKEQAEG